jgi:hypothetical protein
MRGAILDDDMLLVLTILKCHVMSAEQPGLSPIDILQVVQRTRQAPTMRGSPRGYTASPNFRYEMAA